MREAINAIPGIRNTTSLWHNLQKAIQAGRVSWEWFKDKCVASLSSYHTPPSAQVLVDINNAIRSLSREQIAYYDWIRANFPTDPANQQQGRNGGTGGRGGRGRGRGGLGGGSSSRRGKP